jgi:uncharacterized protein involved in exopolysaccharide biosynthesis
MEASGPARPRKWKRLILIPSLTGLTFGFLATYFFSPHYTSQAVIIVRRQTIPAAVVPPLIIVSLVERMALLSERILSTPNLQLVIHAVDPQRPSNGPEQSNTDGELIQNIRANIEITPMITAFDAASAPDNAESNISGVAVTYYDSDPRRAQKICNALAQQLITENLNERANQMTETTRFLEREVEEARTALESMDQQKLMYLERFGHNPETEIGKATLERDYNLDQKNYADLQTKLFQAKLAADMENRGDGEQLIVAQSANLPEAPVFPNRLLSAFAGLCIGLAIGLVLAIRNRLRNPPDIAEQVLSPEPVPDAIPQRSFFRRSAS